MAKGLETYLEYSVKYDRNGNLVVKEDGTPEVLELLQECRLDQLTVKTLNDNWKSFGKFYIKKEAVVAATKVEEETDIWGKTESEVDEMFANSSKAKMLDLYGLSYDKNKINLITVPMAKEMVNTAIKTKRGE